MRALALVRQILCHKTRLLISGVRIVTGDLRVTYRSGFISSL